MQNQLHNIFDEEMQIKRVGKQISYFTSNQQIKPLLDHRLTYIRKQQLIFHISLRAAYFSKHRLDASLSPLNFKIIYTNSYPYSPPRLYFVSENINQLYTVIGRDYFRQVCPDWTAKVQLLDVLPMVGGFIERISREEQQHRVGLYNRGEFIEMEPLYSLKSSEFYPIQAMINQKPESAFLIINRFDFILLEPSPIQNYLRLVDAYSLSSIKSILRSKRTQKKVVLLMKILSDEIALEFLSDDHDNIIESIIQKKRNAPVYEEYPDGEAQPEPQQPKQQQPQPAPRYSLDQINEEIVIYESMLDKDFSETVVNSLIQLYNKAIEMCSATASDNYKLYLDKLRDLLSNETVQVLMSSTVPVKDSNKDSIFAGEQPPDFEKQVEKEYQSESKNQEKKQDDDMTDFFTDSAQPPSNDVLVIMSSAEVSFSKPIAEVEGQQQQQQPKLHSYGSIHKMLQATYKQVDRMINHVRNDEINSQGISKFNYTGKRYRFQKEEERMRESLNVPKPEIVQVSKTVQSIQTEVRQAASTKTEAPQSITMERDFPSRSMPMNYKLVFEKSKDNVARVTPPNEPSFPTKQRIMEAKIHRLQKQVNLLKTTHSSSLRKTQGMSNISDRIDDLIPTRQKKDGKIHLDSCFYDKYAD